MKSSALTCSSLQASPEHASGPASSGDELRTPVEEGTDLSMMPIPKLDHRITIKGRTAYATRIPGTRADLSSSYFTNLLACLKSLPSGYWFLGLAPSQKWQANAPVQIASRYEHQAIGE
eukprot:1161093-Pelagomonas_calceolata.AAC.9